MSVMGSLVRSGRTEITDKLRREVERVVKGYVEQGVAEVVPGVVFIDEVGSYIQERLTSDPHTVGAHARYRVFHFSQRAPGVTNGTHGDICDKSRSKYRAGYPGYPQRARYSRRLTRSVRALPLQTDRC